MSLALDNTGQWAMFAVMKNRGHKNSLQDLTQKYLKSILEYDPKTGLFTWLVTLSLRKPKGCIAGFPQLKGRIKIGIRGHDYMAHRLAFLYMTGKWPEYEIDHINENPSDNRWENLRHGTPHQNHGNRGKQVNNSSGYKGVCKPTGKNFFIAGIKVHGKRIHLGVFQKAEEAYAAYCAAAKKYYGKWAHHSTT
jgi:HNH endonuclease